MTTTSKTATPTKLRANSFTISNICGGDLRRFRLVDGQLSDAAIRHARRIGFGGPSFGGPAGETAAEEWHRRKMED